MHTYKHLVFFNKFMYLCAFAFHGAIFKKKSDVVMELMGLCDNSLFYFLLLCKVMLYNIKNTKLCISC